MKVSIGQIYTTPGAKFPFSHHMQIWLGKELSAASGNAVEFRRRHGNDFELMIRVSARKGTSGNEIVGPTVFKKTKDVEYTLFLPFDAIVESSESRRAAAVFLVDGTRSVFDAGGIDVSLLTERRASIIDHIASSADMLSGPWTYLQVNLRRQGAARPEHVARRGRR
jgi:hypothetical protein